MSRAIAWKGRGLRYTGCRRHIVTGRGLTGLKAAAAVNDDLLSSPVQNFDWRLSRNDSHSRVIPPWRWPPIVQCRMPELNPSKIVTPGFSIRKTYQRGDDQVVIAGQFVKDPVLRQQSNKDAQNHNNDEKPVGDIDGRISGIGIGKSPHICQSCLAGSRSKPATQ